MAKLFVSYSRKDSKAALKLIDALKEKGHDVWVDWESILPASDWLEQIYHGIEGIDAFLFLVSPNSIKSEVCSVEIGHAVLNNKRIVPVVIQQVKPEDTSDDVRKRNWVFLRRNDNFQDGLAKIDDAINIDFEWVEEHGRLQSRALEWDRKKDPSLLLRGGYLRRARKAIGRAKNKEPLPTELQGHYINHSVAAERRRLLLISMATVALLLMTGLFFFALIQRNLAQENEELARQQQVIAEQNEVEANQQREIAEANEEEATKQRELADEQRQIAEDQKLIADAQRSAARAQIYQTQPGELYTSTLLAIASWKTDQSPEADEILRKNISLLPIPVAQMNQLGGINSLEFNATRDRFVTGGADSQVCVWKASDGQMLFCKTSPKSVNDAVFSPDGEFIITGDSSGEVQIIRILDQSIQKTFNAGSIVWDIDISKDGKEIAVTRDDGKISIVDFETGEEKYPLLVSGKIRIASFSPNGYYIAAGSSTGVVTLWNLDAGGDPVTSGRHTGEVRSLVFSPDSRYLVTGGADGYAVAAYTSNGQQAYRLLHEAAVTDIAFNPSDGSWFATVSNDRRIRLWDTTDGEERIRMEQDSFVNAVSISTNGQWLATTGVDQAVRVWNASTGTEMFQIPIEGDGLNLGFGENGSRLVAGDSIGDINVWDISVISAPESYLQFDGQVGSMQFSPSGDWLAASDGPRIWLLESDPLPTLDRQRSPNIVANGKVTSLIFSPDSKWLGVATDNGQVLVYYFVNNDWRTFTSSGIEHSIAFSPDSAYLLVSQPEGSVDRWNLISREQIVAFAGGLQDVQSMAVSPSYIALGVDDAIEILSIDGKRDVSLSIKSAGDHSLLAFSADGSLLASSNSEGLIEIWRLDNGEFIWVGSIRKETVHSMMFDPTSTQLAVGTTNTVYLIDPLTVKETARIPHAGIVAGVSYQADGDIFATTSLRSIQFWDMTRIQALHSDDLVDEACKRLKENFSEAQWGNLFGGQPYETLCDQLPVP